jgi:ketosteroid isomerase-like protein
VSRENLEIVEAGYAAYNAGDIDTLVAIFASDAVLVPDASVFPEAAPRHGRDEIRAWLCEVGAAWASPAFPITDVVDVGDNQILTRGEWGGRGEASGIELYQSLSAVWMIRDGEISRVEWFFDHDKALKAVGLSE